MAGRNRATVRDVAEAAGVSAQTVSRVVNQSGYVSADARRRVLDAVARLGYSPNVLGRSLRSTRSPMVGLAVSDIGNRSTPACTGRWRRPCARPV